MNRIKRAALVLGVPDSLPVRRTIAKVTIISLALGQLIVPMGIAQAVSFSLGKVNISDPRPYTGSGTDGTNVTYSVNVSSVSSTPIQCITATYVTQPNGSTAVPGMNAVSATVNASSTLLTGASGGSWTTTNTANQVKYTNAGNTGAPTVATGATFVMDGIQNGSSGNVSYWVQFKTFSDAACTAAIKDTTIGFIYTASSLLSLTVDQTLSFTVTGILTGNTCNGGTTSADSSATTIPFGTVSPASNGFVCQLLTAATNATNGYTIYTRYTSAPTNGLGQTIADLGGGTPTPNSAPVVFPAAGITEAYGYTTSDATLSNCASTCAVNRFTNGGQKYAAMTTSNAEVAYEPNGVNTSTYQVAHQVDVTTLTKPGTYTTTVIYTCTPVY